MTAKNRILLLSALVLVICLVTAPAMAQKNRPADETWAPNANAVGGSVDTGFVRVPVSITQSSDTATITGLNSVACPGDDDSYIRRFDLDGEFGIVAPYTVESVDFGVEVGVGATVDVNLYSIPSASPLLFANLTPIGTATIGGLSDLSIQNVLVTGTITDPTTTDLVVEIFAPDFTQGFSFFVGSNPNGQTAPTYLSSAFCGAPEPTDTATLGFPGMHMVMIVNGDEASGPILQLTNATDTDQCVDPAGNVNGIWEPGEAINFDLELSAAGGDHANITCSLSSASPDVTIVSGVSDWPNLTSGSSGTNLSPLQVLLDPATACLSMVDIDVTCASDQGMYNFALMGDIGEALVPTGLPLAIPDNDPGGASSTLSVSQDVTLNDVDVRVQISHTWVGDLIITLQGPGGTVTLLDRPGIPVPGGAGCSDDNMDVTFDDSSGFDPETHCPGTDPWYVGDALPVDALSLFNGQSSMGDWILTVSDNAGADLGTVDNWELITDPPISGTCNTCLDAGAGGASVLEIPTLDWRAMLLLMAAMAGLALWKIRR